MKRTAVDDIPPGLMEAFRTSSEVAIDCEMMGLNPHRDRLCLVQAINDKGDVAIIQIDENKGAPNLREILENPSITKIFHFARMDCLFLRYRLNASVQNIFCTKIASKIARTYTDKHGLKELVREFTGENLDKNNQSSDWGKSELSSEQLLYAEGDVRYLHKIKNILTEMLVRENRMHLAQASFLFLPFRIEMDFLGYDDVLSH